ncbi:acetyl-CoA carboxylase biotin carboxyl carrier protein subunit [Psychrobacillus sp. NPDC093180]|uniref:acetyl-CoA carboxylase biotin carboxyl carrier protein subunit n=1 Tax=Psychrobacillus sp. NPDC093180 TaxID=3364489 RepID=UPI00380A47B0
MKNLASTMAGTVFTINIAAGEEVSAGQVVLVLESMKMEIPIEAETAGKVAAINVKEGDFVNEGDVLVTFE